MEKLRSQERLAMVGGHCQPGARKKSREVGASRGRWNFNSAAQRKLASRRRGVPDGTEN